MQNQTVSEDLFNDFWDVLLRSFFVTKGSQNASNMGSKVDAEIVKIQVLRKDVILERVGVGVGVKCTVFYVFLEWLYMFLLVFVVI